MKSNAIIRIVLWSLTAIILIGVMVFAIVYHGFKDVNLGKSSYTYKNENAYSIGNTTIEKDIDDFNINWISGKISVKVYDGNTININEGNVKKEDDKLRYLVDGNSLTIQFKKSGFSVGISKSIKKNLTIEIPSSIAEKITRFSIDSTSALINVSDITVKNKMILDTVSGDVTIDNLNTDYIDINNVSGNITLNNSTINILKYETVSGGINATGEYKNVDTDAVSAGVDIESTVPFEKCKTNSVSGYVMIKMPENDGFTVYFDKVSGKLNSDFPFTSSDTKYVYKNGQGDFSFSTVSGNVTIKKIS